MKHTFLLTMILFIFSCGKDKVILLPEISHSEISEINDVSPAYLFYDETKSDGVELNRKNLISTTNWLVNVDKRLTLKQVIPHIKFLQEKKKNSSHKNKNAKNYFTCNDTSKKNLGFIEFTDVVYEIDIDNAIFPDLNSRPEVAHIYFKSFEKIETDIMLYEHGEKIILNFTDLIKYLDNTNDTVIKLSFNSNVSFQDYITVKSKILSKVSDNLRLFNHELINN